MKEDLLALLGIILIAVGVWFEFSWTYSIMFLGAMFLIIGVLSVRVSKQDIKRADS